ncbi:hypothetical protein N8H72_12800 [Pseudomonas koreensis]|uniref:hypothetical protein n=1 Tax=Pseudomonas koreensis TaxID=198620 RepID=UPI0021C874C1|nr:hypothetical protein [Pseudomonas koreensis]MCU0090842.1 hypothetical protein [Pseudomonas koreensis]
MNQPQSVQAGTLDPTFNGNGKLYFPLPEIFAAPDAVLALPDGKVLVAMGPAVSGGPITLARLNDDGSLDRSFGPAQIGFVEVPFDTDVFIFGLILLASGGWLIVGQYVSVAESGLLVVQQLQDGRLDASLAGDGKLYIPYDGLGAPEYAGVKQDIARRKGDKVSGGGARSSGSAGVIAVEQVDGKIVLVANAIDASGTQRGIVLRRNYDGSPDRDFGKGGYAVVELPSVDHKFSSAKGVAVQADGQIVVCGRYVTQVGSAGGYVICFNSNGELEHQFNGGLPVIVEAPLADLRQVTLRASDGRIVALGNTRQGNEQNGLIVVLNKNGSYNLLFNNGQPLCSKLVPEGLDWTHCGQQVDGSLVVTGTTGNRFITEDIGVITARYRSDGVLDTTFNPGNGFTVFNEDRGVETDKDLAVMADGRIVVCCTLWEMADPFPYIIGGIVLRYIV